MTDKVLFVLHVILILCALSAGLFFPWYVIVGCVAVHQAHVYWFKGCWLTNYQKKVRAMPSHQNFFQHLSERMFGVQLSVLQSQIVYATIIMSSICLSILRFGMYPIGY